MRLESDVIEVLDRAAIDGLSLVLVGQLDRQLYVRANRALEALGGKWNEKAKAHLFDHDPAEAIEMAVLTGIVTDQKREMGFFETPRPIALRLIDLAGIMPDGDATVLEPSAGLGAILKLLPLGSQASARRRLSFCELDSRRREALAAYPYGFLAEADFLKVVGKWDKVVANPPFGGAQRDVDHVRHMWDCLNPGGILVSVMASGITFRHNRKTDELRGLVEENGEIIPLPEHSFRESGTDVSIVIVRMQK